MLVLRGCDLVGQKSAEALRQRVVFGMHDQGWAFDVTERSDRVEAGEIPEHPPDSPDVGGRDRGEPQLACIAMRASAEERRVRDEQMPLERGRIRAREPRGLLERMALLLILRSEPRPHFLLK